MPETAIDAAADEPVLEPQLPICDAHHHLWRRERSTYWLEELLADTGSGHRIESTVFVDCVSEYRPHGPRAMRPVGETEAMHAIAEQTARSETRACAAIVGHVDMLLGDAVQPVLEAHLAASDRFRGIRHTAGWDASDAVRNSHTDPPRGLLGDARFRAAFARLEPLGLVFDAWLFHPQIGDVTALARAFPGARIVLDHYGGPLGIGPYAGRADEVWGAWRASIDELAACENVFAKLGGIHMPLNGFGWHERDQRPDSQEIADATRRYVHHTIERFGPERCMFESNFPVDAVSCSYRVLWNAFKRIVADATPAEKALLFHDTAATFYRIPPA